MKNAAYYILYSPQIHIEVWEMFADVIYLLKDWII